MAAVRAGLGKDAAQVKAGGNCFGHGLQKGEMNMIAVILCGILGSLLGALVNYYLAIKLGRPLLIRYGKYMLCFKNTTYSKWRISLHAMVTFPHSQAA